jgi:TonB family protein
MPRGKGGQAGAQIAFSPDGQYLFLTVGDRQRMTPAQDPDQPVGKILRLTLDGKPAPGNPNFGKTGAATVPLIDPPKDTEAAKTAKVVSTYTFPGPNLTPSETWASGVRTPYGLAFSPSGELWEVEHGPMGGDELNLIEPGKNYGWPLVSYGMNYNTVPIPSPDTRPDLAKPVLYWVPVIAPGNLMFYTGTQTFPEWNGSGFVSGLASTSITRLLFDGHGGAKPAERWDVGKRIRDIAEGPDGSLWLLEDDIPGALIHLTPKATASHPESVIGGLAGGPPSGFISGMVSNTPVAPPPPPPSMAATPRRITVGGGVQGAMAISKPSPVYPQDARQARIQGVVKLHVVIDEEGKIAELEVISGQPLLTPAAVDAVKKWRYRPTILNNFPVQVDTTIDVNFELTP